MEARHREASRPCDLALVGGAVGVGIGVGLQRVASNFICGFILELDRSVKPGDVISVGTPTDGSSGCARDAWW